MKHWIVFYYIICFSVGFAGNVVSILAYLKTKNKTAKYFIFFNIFLSSLVITDTLYFYVFSVASYQNISIDALFAGILFLSLGGLIFFSPYVADLFIGKPFGLKKKLIFGILSLSSLFFIILPYFLSTDGQKILELLWFELYSIYVEIFYAMLIYTLIRIFLAIKKAESPIIKKVLKTILILTLIFLPGFVADSSWKFFQVNLKIIPRYFNFMPIYFFCWNLFIIIYSFKYVIMKGDEKFVLTELPGTFIKEFHITDRERDVILLVLKGFNHHQISEKIFISTGTVRNYISTIYQKTYVNNKLSLLNLIQNYLSSPNSNS